MCEREGEKKLVWVRTCVYAVFSAVAGLPHSQSVTEDVLVNLDPHTCQRLRHCPPAGLIVRALTEEAVSIKCQYDFIPNIHLNET